MFDEALVVIILTILGGVIFGMAWLSRGQVSLKSAVVMSLAGVGCLACAAVLIFT